MVLNHRLRAPLNLNLLSTLAWDERSAVGWRSYGRKNNSPSPFIARLAPGLGIPEVHRRDA